jgi:hypothetical protein
VILPIKIDIKNKWDAQLLTVHEENEEKLSPTIFRLNGLISWCFEHVFDIHGWNNELDEYWKWYQNFIPALSAYSFYSDSAALIFIRASSSHLNSSISNYNNIT